MIRTSIICRYYWQGLRAWGIQPNALVILSRCQGSACECLLLILLVLSVSLIPGLAWGDEGTIMCFYLDVKVDAYRLFRRCYVTSILDAAKNTLICNLRFCRWTDEKPAVLSCCRPASTDMHQRFNFHVNNMMTTQVESRRNCVPILSRGGAVRPLQNHCKAIADVESGASF